MHPGFCTLPLHCTPTLHPSRKHWRECLSDPGPSVLRACSLQEQPEPEWLQGRADPYRTVHNRSGVNKEASSREQPGKPEAQQAVIWSEGFLPVGLGE